MEMRYSSTSSTENYSLLEALLADERRALRGHKTHFPSRSSSLAPSTQTYSAAAPALIVPRPRKSSLLPGAAVPELRRSSTGRSAMGTAIRSPQLSPLQSLVEHNPTRFYSRDIPMIASRSLPQDFIQLSRELTPARSYINNPVMVVPPPLTSLISDLYSLQCGFLSRASKPNQLYFAAIANSCLYLYSASRAQSLLGLTPPTLQFAPQHGPDHFMRVVYLNAEVSTKREQMALPSSHAGMFGSTAALAGLRITKYSRVHVAEEGVYVLQVSGKSLDVVGRSVETQRPRDGRFDENRRILVDIEDEYAGAETWFLQLGSADAMMEWIHALREVVKYQI